MKTIAAISACALLALAAPAFAQSASGSSTKALQDNGSPSGASPSHAKLKGDRGTESGRAPKVQEGRSSAKDTKGSSAMKSGNGKTGQNEVK
jgi:hypothetical protein